ncbi:hypothetical protein, partial [Paenibacillus sonchi]|uniref:hypothetical protein n=1 Tax=Paenibacillus sonchi TaxID=373687 RepID=UPI001ADFF1EE
ALPVPNFPSALPPFMNLLSSSYLYSRMFIELVALLFDFLILMGSQAVLKGAPFAEVYGPCPKKRSGVSPLSMDKIVLF